MPSHADRVNFIIWYGHVLRARVTATQGTGHKRPNARHRGRHGRPAVARAGWGRAALDAAMNAEAAAAESAGFWYNGRVKNFPSATPIQCDVWYRIGVARAVSEFHSKLEQPAEQSTSM